MIKINQNIELFNYIGITGMRKNCNDPQPLFTTDGFHHQGFQEAIVLDARAHFYTFNACYFAFCWLVHYQMCSLEINIFFHVT